MIVLLKYGGFSKKSICNTKKVHIKKDAFLGTNSVVLPGVTIGEGAIVGANSLVRESVPDYAIAVGVPTKIVGTRSKINVPDS